MAEALDREETLLPVIERILGPEHRDTLGVRIDIAHWTRKARRRASQATGIRTVSPTAQAVGTRLRCISSTAWHAGQVRPGDPDQARDRYAALLSERERILGPEHPDTGVARRNLAYWTHLAGSEED